MLKHTWFIVLTGLVGSASGIVTFIVTRWLVENLALRLVTGGLVAVIVPIVVVGIFYPMLNSKKPQDQ